MSHIYIDIAQINNYTADANTKKLVDTNFIKEDWMRSTLYRIYYILYNHTYVSDENIELYYVDEETGDEIFNQDEFDENYKPIAYSLQTNDALKSFKIGDKIYVSSNTEGVVYSYEIFMILWILLIPKGIIILTPPVEIWYEVFNAPPPDSLILQNFISNLKYENIFIISIKHNLKLQDNSSTTTDYDPTYYQERKSFPSLINNAYFKTKTSAIPKKKSNENYKEKYKSFISNPDCMASIFYPYTTSAQYDNIKDNDTEIYKSNASMWTNTSFLNNPNYVNNFWKIFKTYKKLDISQDDIDKVYNAILGQQDQGLKNLYGKIVDITDNDLKDFRMIYKLIVPNVDENIITKSNIIDYFDPIWNEFVEEYKAARVYLNSDKTKTDRVFKLVNYENKDQSVYLNISDNLLEKYCTMSGICNQIRIDNDVFNAFVRIYKKLGGKKDEDNLENNDMFWKDIGEIWSRIGKLKNMK